MSNLNMYVVTDLNDDDNTSYYVLRFQSDKTIVFKVIGPNFL
jgi:hypothetical protein